MDLLGVFLLALIGGCLIGYAVGRRDGWNAAEVYDPTQDAGA